MGLLALQRGRVCSARGCSGIVRRGSPNTGLEHPPTHDVAALVDVSLEGALCVHEGKVALVGQEEVAQERASGNGRRQTQQSVRICCGRAAEAKRHLLRLGMGMLP